MIYRVSAKFNFDKTLEYLQKLIDGSIEKQRPDGPEIIRAMYSATIDENGIVNWTEKCFCPTPLKHERETVYDFYFTELNTIPTPKHEITAGVSFICKLHSLSAN
ncbi:hypothetical protein [Croceivirga thetidis]|uniref:Uncharacterized protein n=1 Tax=Croceivirga thetidis TaxID=2721623 RepID=A0ABX1GKL5_9FLAO|nr:hypothetical protein [Croceivirga thetidis]NKI30442.1 hypothetical protein [Croceivirga thetidis]